MIVRVRLFAQLRESAGSSTIELDLPSRAKVRDALAAVEHLSSGLPIVMAVNREYAHADVELRPDDELALVPPVSGGGEAPRLHARITDRPLSLDAIAALVTDEHAGAVVTFSGATRDVPYLDYEAYWDMALTELQRIVAAVAWEHDLCAAAAEHRIGRVGTTEASVIVAASAPHRPAAFAGARALIDEIKVRVPIWKKEDGDWVEGVAPSVQ